MSKVSTIGTHIFKIGALCLLFLIFCSGVVLAENSIELDVIFDINPNDSDNSFPYPGSTDVILGSLGYIEKVYISDTTVTIETSNMLSDINPTWRVVFIPLYGSPAGDNNTQEVSFRQLDSNIIQFDVSPDNPGFYNVSLMYVSNFDFSQNIIIQNYDDIGHDASDKLPFIYLPCSFVTINDTHYYIHDYRPYLSSGLFNLNEVEGKNFIYFFDDINLRSVYWYGSNDSDIIHFTPEINAHDPVSILPYKPVFYINPFKTSDFSLNQFFICPAHDLSETQKFNDLHECADEIQWKVLVNGNEKDASLFFETNNEILSQHSVSFSDLNPLKAFFSSSQDFDSQEVELLIYPVLSSSINFKSFSLPFSFKMNSAIYEEIITIPFENSGIFIDNLNQNKPSLSSLSFSGTAGDEINEILSGSSIIIKTLNENEFSGISEIPSTAEIFTVIDIDFTRNKSELNQYLSSTNQKAILTFTIPKIVNGAVINPENLKIYHFKEVDGKSKLEELNLIEISESEDLGIQYYVLSAETSSFSSFAVVSQSSRDGEDVHNPPEIPSEKSTKSSSGGINNIDILQPKESGSSTDSSPNINSPIFTIPDLVEKVSGHLSLFSVIVVLVSGIFMWNYIHRKV
jgi:hypothetical protein